MENSQDTRSQLAQANEQLVNMAPDITASDRKAAMITYSELTIISYLKGRGRKLDTAINLLKLFRERIEKRNEFLMGQ